MRTSVIVAVALFLGSAAAGCVGSEGTAPAGPAGAGAPVFDDTTGAIEGLVTNDELSPIPGAQVGIVALNAVAITDAEGRYVLSSLPPGSYDVIAVALGFDPASKKVAVEVGAAVRSDFQLVPLPVDGPYFRTVTETLTLTGVMYKLTPTCIYEPLTSINPRAKTCGGVRTTTCTRCETHTGDKTYKKFNEFNENWTTIVSELSWKPQSGATGRGFLMDVNAPNVSRGDSGSINQASKYTWYKSDDQSPLKIRIDKSGLAERGIPESDWNNYDGETCTSTTVSGSLHCDWFWRVFPAYCDLGNCEQGFGPDYGVMVDGTATIYFSFFIRDPAKPEFSALPDR